MNLTECKSPIFDDIISWFGADQSEYSICMQTDLKIKYLTENWSEVVTFQKLYS